MLTPAKTSLFLIFRTQLDAVIKGEWKTDECMEEKRERKQMMRARGEMNEGVEMVFLASTVRHKLKSSLVVLYYSYFPSMCLTLSSVPLAFEVHYILYFLPY